MKASNSGMFWRDFAGEGARATFEPIHIHEHEAGGVPDFVGEGAIALGAALAEGNVGAGRGHGRQGEAGCIRAEALDDLERIDYVALGLRHLLPFSVTHQGMDVNLPEGHAVVLLPLPAAGLLDSGILLVTLHEVATEHDHAR